MARDAQGNDLEAVKYVVTSKILVAPYDNSVQLTAAMIKASVADVASTLPSIFKGDVTAVGLITSDGAPQDGRDADDATEFHQPGYKMAAEPSLTLEFTVAEDNELTRLMTIGTPDEDGVYHVKDVVQDTKWFAYQETAYKNGTIRRRLGVIQITGNEPAQDTRGEVSGLALTASWSQDSTVDHGNARYLQSYYNPKADAAVSSLTVSPTTLSVEAGKTAKITATVVPAGARVTAESSDKQKATVSVSGAVVTVTGVAQTSSPVTVTVKAGAQSKTITVTVTNAA